MRNVFLSGRAQNPENILLNVDETLSAAVPTSIWAENSVLKVKGPGEVSYKAGTNGNHILLCCPCSHVEI